MKIEPTNYHQTWRTNSEDWRMNSFLTRGRDFASIWTLRYMRSCSDAHVFLQSSTWLFSFIFSVVQLLSCQLPLSLGVRACNRWSSVRDACRCTTNLNRNTVAEIPDRASTLTFPGMHRHRALLFWQTSPLKRWCPSRQRSDSNSSRAYAESTVYAFVHLNLALWSFCFFCQYISFCAGIPIHHAYGC